MYFFYFYPLGLDRKPARPPVLSWGVMAVLAVAFVWMRYLPGALPLDPWRLVCFPGEPPAWAVLTAVFMHVSWLHLLGNLLYFWVFGPPLETRLGRARFLLTFLICGVAGNLAHGFVSVLGLLGQGGWGVMGSSGAIAGLLGFSLIRLYDAKLEIAWWVLAPLGGQNRAGRSRLPVLGAVGLWLLWQTVQALLADLTGASVSFGAHLGGFFMGLGLALAAGEHRAGRAEAQLARGRSYFRRGQFHAAAGDLSAYVDACPDDPTGRLELARALRIGGGAQADVHYRRVFAQHVQDGLIDPALQVFDEWNRARGPGAQHPGELAQAAYYKEKRSDYPGALDVYRQLYQTYPAHPQGQRALVRVIVLAQGKLGDPQAAGAWLQEAHRNLAPGSWRDFLEREFMLPAAPGATAAAGRPVRPAAGSTAATRRRP